MDEVVPRSSPPVPPGGFLFLAAAGIESEEIACLLYTQLMKLMFCMFADNIELRPSKIFQVARRGPQRPTKTLRSLFDAMPTAHVRGQ